MIRILGTNSRIFEFKIDFMTYAWAKPQVEKSPEVIPKCNFYLKKKLALPKGFADRPIESDANSPTTSSQGNTSRTGYSMRNRDQVKSECVEYRTNEYYNFAETVRKFRRAFGVSAIGQQILNLALFVLSGNFVRRIWRHSKICQSMQCQGSKVGCVFVMVISSNFCMGQHRADDHQEDAPHFN